MNEIKKGSELFVWLDFLFCVDGLSLNGVIC